MFRGAIFFKVELVLAAFFLFAISLSVGAQEIGPKGDNSPIEEEQITSDSGLISQKTLKKIDEMVRRIDLKARLKTEVDTEEFGAGAYWQRRVEASYRQGFTTLIDDFKLSARISPTALSTGEGVKDGVNGHVFGLGADGFVRLLFARQFEGNGLKDHLKTLVETPYKVWEFLPMTAERALTKMVQHDVVQFQSQFNLIVSASQLKMLAPHIPLTIGATYLMSGEFQVHLYRLSDKKFRLKLIGIRGREGAGFLRIGYSVADDIKISRINFVDKLVRRRFNFVPFEIAMSVPRSNLFIVDYVLDMAKPEVKAAFDTMMDGMWNPKTFKYLNPYNSREEMQDMVVADATAFQDIYDREKDKSIDERIVDRRFRGANDVLAGGGIRIEVGQRDIGALRWNQSYTENYITATDRFNNPRSFFMPIYTILSGYRLGVGYVEEETQRSASILFETNINKDITSFGELSFYLEHKDKKMDSGEIQDYKNLIRKRIPSELYDQIDWKDWADNHARSQARITSLLVFRPNSLAYAEGLDYTQVRDKFVSYAKSFPQLEATPQADLEGNNNKTTRITSRKFEDRFHFDLMFIANSLTTVFNKNETGRRRTDVFVAMRSNPLWAEIGGGFLVHLLETEAKRQKGEKGIDDLLKHIYYETTWEAKNSDTVHEIFGPCTNRRLYKAVMYIYSVLTNRGMEMRLIDDDDAPGLPDKAKELECED